MRILCCLNRDLASNYALNLLLPTLSRHTVRVGLTERVGSSQPDDSEPPERRELRTMEQQIPNELLFPLIERAKLPDINERLLTFSEIEQLRGIRIEALLNPNTSAGLDTVRSFAPDLILTIRYGAILKSPVISIPRYGVLNLHSGILPAYRGVLATFRALLNGDSEIGCTLHRIEDGTIDTGTIVDIARISVDPRRSLLWHVLALYPTGAGMLNAAINRLAEGALVAGTSQSKAEGSYYSYPTAEEWREFMNRGWRIACPHDWVELLKQYSAGRTEGLAV